MKQLKKILIIIMLLCPYIVKASTYDIASDPYYVTEVKNQEEVLEEEKRYKLNYLDKSVSSLIPYETLRKLNNSLNHNSISLFVYLLKRYIANGEKEYNVTMAQMKKFIGIAHTTTSNNEIITDILEVLNLLGLVEYEYRQVEQDKTLLFITKMNNKVKDA